MDVKGSILAAWIAAALVSVAALVGLSAMTDPPAPEGHWRNNAAMEERLFHKAPGHSGAPEHSLRYRGP